MENGPGLKMYSLLTMVIFHGDLLVYRSVRKGKLIIQEGMKRQFFWKNW